MPSSGDYVIRDEDRLPWLETVDEDYQDGPSIFRIGVMIALGLCILAAAIFGIYWFRKSDAPQGNGELIAAQEGDYKVRPDTPGGMKVEGEGDTAFAISEGKGASNASIDLKAMPETPMPGNNITGTKAAAKPGAGIVPPKGGALKAPAPGALAIAARPVAAASGGSLVQLGSFPNEAAANGAWAKSAKRFAYLAPLGKSVQVATVNGRTVYRLRVNAGSATQAGEICGKLKVAGEACFVARN
jgi:hypothetical protein